MLSKVWLMNWSSDSVLPSLMNSALLPLISISALQRAKVWSLISCPKSHNSVECILLCNILATDSYRQRAHTPDINVFATLLPGKNIVSSKTNIYHSSSLHESIVCPASSLWIRKPAIISSNIVSISRLDHARM